MKLLSIDPGTKCGYALWDNGVVISGVWSCAVKRNEGAGMRFIRMNNYLATILPVDICGYEEVRKHRGTDAAHIYGGITAIIMAKCEATNTQYIPIPVGTIKKHATGKGNAGKPDMVAAAKKLYPQCAVVDDNEADALCLLDYLIKEYA
jgi:Holliday junction resolvasome RuvABC endonuclease subunit